ncbi:DUF4832 domain-containing protein [Tundrisphaera sp. TA3]|uniref:DUF4832 domain-containing protein n=1 Tax=Tundrisphaera sp. TA3 TaxID=3435775 RepID=UPI003EBFBF84
MRLIWIGLLVLVPMASGLAAPPEPEVVVRPSPAPGPLDNPLKGWCPYADAGPIRQPYSMVFLYAPWKDLEPEEGRYAFDRWERRSWSAPRAAGKHVVLRVYIDYPSRPSGLPGWLKEKGVKLTPYADHGGGLSPDYDDPRMVAAMERLIEAMGRRYDGDPRVAFIQLGLLGFWGEWHTWPKGKLYASKETERRVIDAYRRAFPHKILMARYARDAAGDQPWLGFHDDMFPDDTDNGHDWSFLAGLRKSGRMDNWQRAAIGGEMEPHRAKKWLGEGYEHTVEMVERSHFTWVGPYAPALDASRSPEFLGRSEALVRRMGYQFRLDEVRHPATVAPGGSLTVAIRGENQGVAPFYYPWPVELALINAAGKVAGRWPLRCDVRSWRPGPFQVDGGVEANSPPGRYRLALGIIDPWTGRPAIAFANDLPRHEGWTVISEVSVGPVQ